MPAAAAGRTSLSTRSPTYATSAGGHASRSATAAKNAGSGFSTPSVSLEATRSSGTSTPPNTASAACGWLPATPTRKPAARRPARAATASGYRSSGPMHGSARPLAPLPHGVAQVEVGPQDADRLEVVATALDDRAQHGEERQALDPEPVRPGQPLAVLVDERLADVEHDRPDRASSHGPRQRERSCQLTPPSGAPGSFWCGSPVRLSTCSTPRR